MKRWAMLVLVGLLAAVLAACGSGSGEAEDQTAPESEEQVAGEAAEDSGEAEYQRACALFDEGKFFSAKEAFEASGYQDWEQRAAECVQPMPATGELWHNDELVSDEMMLTFDVNEDDAVGLYIAVYTQDNVLAETLFIQGSGTVDTMLPGGNYYIKDASGTAWYGDIELFGRDGHYETMVFDEFENDRYLTALDAGYKWAISINTTSDEGQGVSSEEDAWGSWN